MTIIDVISISNVLFILTTIIFMSSSSKFLKIISLQLLIISSILFITVYWVITINLLGLIYVSLVLEFCYIESDILSILIIISLFVKIIGFLLSHNNFINYKFIIIETFTTLIQIIEILILLGIYLELFFITVFS